MEITLTLDDELVARARTVAEARQTTLDSLFRELLEEACQAGAGDEFVRLAHEHSGRSALGWRFHREAFHDRAARG